MEKLPGGKNLGERWGQAVFDIKPLVEFTFFENNNTQKENLSVQYFFIFFNMNYYVRIYL